MKKFLKVNGIIFLVFFLITAILFGIRTYNVRYYSSPNETSPMDKSSYETSDQVKSIEGDYLNGFHFTPKERKHPGTVVVFGGSEGSPDYRRAQALSAEGYEVLSLFFFGQPNQKEMLAEVPLEMFDEVREYAENNVEKPEPMTVIGSSKGAELTANLAARGAKIDNIALFTPSEFTYQGLSFGRQTYSSFTENGQPVPYLSFNDADKKATASMFFGMMAGLPISYRETYESMAQRASNVDEALIPIQNFAGQGVLFAGNQDAMWQGDVSARNMSAQNSRLEAHVYPEAGHLFADDITKAGRGWKKMLGGTVEGNRAAKEESDKVLNAKLAEWHGSMN